MYHAVWPGLNEPGSHGVSPAQDPQLSDPGARVYALDERAFHRQMRIVAEGFTCSSNTWESLALPDPPRSVWITFDDGHRSNAEIALPILQKLGLRGIFFITTDWIGQPGFMDEDQIRGLQAAGMLIGSHGCSHAYFSDLTADDLKRELVESRARLESITGQPVTGLSLPGGSNQRAVRQLAAEAGYSHLFTSRIDLADASTDPLDWPRIPITNRLSMDLFSRIVAGDRATVNRLARGARLRVLARRLMGNRLYDRLRDRILAQRREH